MYINPIDSKVIYRCWCLYRHNSYQAIPLYLDLQQLHLTYIKTKYDRILHYIYIYNDLFMLSQLIIGLKFNPYTSSMSIFSLFYFQYHSFRCWCLYRHSSYRINVYRFRAFWMDKSTATCLFFDPLISRWTFAWWNYLVG
jgi:hypothetical protein